MKKVAIIISSIIAFTACSFSEVIEHQPLEEIVFQSSTGGIVRAVYDQKNPLQQFYVWGLHNDNGTLHYVMDGLAVNKQSDGSWSYDGKRYWPVKGTVDFYGIYPSSSVAQTIMDPRTNTPVSEVDYTVSDTKREIRFKALRAKESMNYAAALPDLLYAVSKEQSKVNNPVSMMFRHAMSVVRFEIKNESSMWTIRFRPDSAVVICNVNSEGTYTLPDVSTSADVATKGSWEFPEQIPQNFTVFTGSDVYVEGMKDHENSYIRPAGQEGNVNPPFMKNGESAVMLPCTATAWDPKSGPATAATQNGAYFKIYCRVEVNTPSMQEGTPPYVLWGDLDAKGPTDEGYYAPVYVPVDIDWEEGVNYKYTFAFGRGLAYDENGNASVVKLTFSTEAAEFIGSAGNIIL